MVDIVVMDSKTSHWKHEKYVEFYRDLNDTSAEYWGIGIENETYLMFKQQNSVEKRFILENRKPERYSVDYWKNYKEDELMKTLSYLPDTIMVPTYINAYMFQNSDMYGEHKKLYNTRLTANPKSHGFTMDKYLRFVSPVVSRLFEKNMIYDGDAFEFTTFNFYKTNVQTAVNELKTIKAAFLKEVNSKMVDKEFVLNKEVIYPPYNYGFAKHISNPKNIATCNNGTYHINITLPTALDASRGIADPDKFRRVHANAIRAIQWIEPLLAGVYGSPDILYVMNPDYAGGSQRLSLSRYIGMGTYDTEKMEKGKILDTFDYTQHSTYFKELHRDSPYVTPEKIGYDFNYNKFLKHGIELRILDSFPEEYLESVINLIILVCDISTYKDIPDPTEYVAWNEMAISCLRYGSDSRLGPNIYNMVYAIFDMNPCYWWPFQYSESPINVLRRIANHLYYYFSKGVISKKLSPNMRPIELHNVNLETKEKFRDLLRPLKNKNNDVD